MRKCRNPLNPHEIEVLKGLSELSPDGWSEEDVREEFITPLLRLLGYKKNSNYEISRAESHSIDYLMIGRKRVQIDYICHIRKEKLWVIEAKPGNATISDKDVLQANYYSLHPDINAPYFIVTNAKELLLFERDARKSDGSANLRISTAELADPEVFYRLDSIIGSSQILPTLKRNLLNAITKVLSAEVHLERLDEFLLNVRKVLGKVRPKVLENFRNNAHVQEQVRIDEFEREISIYTETTPLYDVVDTLFLNYYTRSQSQFIYERLLLKMQKFPSQSSQNRLFIKRIIGNEDFYLRTIPFYSNQLGFLMFLSNRGADFIAEINTKDLLHDKIRQCLSHFRGDAKYRYLWSYECLFRRLAKMIIILSPEAKDILRNIGALNDYITQEEEVAWLGPNSAKDIIELVDNYVLRALSAIIRKYYDPGKKLFKEELCREYYKKIQCTISNLERDYGDRYKQLRAELGQKWREILGYDYYNHYWDVLGSVVCDLLYTNRTILEGLPPDIIQRIVEIAGIGNANYAAKCCDYLKLDYKEGSIAINLDHYFDATYR